METGVTTHFLEDDEDFEVERRVQAIRNDKCAQQRGYDDYEHLRRAKYLKQKMKEIE